MEYEYSFEVKSLKKYIEYCEKNNYTKISKTKETRIIYRNINKTIARITIEDNKRALLDFKDDILSGEILIKRRETPKIIIDHMDAIIKMLEFLKYKKDNTLLRERIIYKKGEVTFELDSYEEPKKTFIVAIEGYHQEVDEVYKEIINLK